MVNMTQIDEFRRRTNSSYEDARLYLEKHNGDVLEAILDFEKSRSGKRPLNADTKSKSGWTGFAEILQKGFDIQVIVMDTENTIFGVPLLLLLLLLPYWFVFFLIGIFLIFIGFKLRVVDEKNSCVDMVNVFDAIGKHLGSTHQGQGKKPAQNSPNSATPPPTQEMVATPQPTAPVEPVTQPQEMTQPARDQGYKEYTIE